MQTNDGVFKEEIKDKQDLYMFDSDKNANDCKFQVIDLTNPDEFITRI